LSDAGLAQKKGAHINHGIRWLWGETLGKQPSDCSSERYYFPIVKTGGRHSLKGREEKGKRKGEDRQSPRGGGKKGTAASRLGAATIIKNYVPRGADASRRRRKGKKKTIARAVLNRGHALRSRRLKETKKKKNKKREEAL